MQAVLSKNLYETTEDAGMVHAQEKHLQTYIWFRLSKILKNEQRKKYSNNMK